MDETVMNPIILTDFRDSIAAGVFIVSYRSFYLKLTAWGHDFSQFNDKIKVIIKSYEVRGMGIFEFLIATVPVALFFSVPLYAIKRRSDQKDDRLKIDHIREQKELEQDRQENYLLENKQMRIELDKIKEERALKERNGQKNDRWLIEESKEREL